MRAFSLFVLLAGLTVSAGCSSTDYDRWGRSSPSSSRAESHRGGDRYVVCHRGRSQTVNRSAVRAHLNHGDRLGSCDRSDRRDRRYDRRSDNWWDRWVRGDRRDRDDRYDRDRRYDRDDDDDDDDDRRRRRRGGDDDDD